MLGGNEDPTFTRIILATGRGGGGESQAVGTVRQG